MAPVKRPTQAVILAGGRGTRLTPITDTIPKPMIEFHGKPFLEYLIEMLREQGFERILLLLGYLPEKVQEYFGDGSTWNVSIEYSVTPVDNETGRRLQAVRNQLDQVFLLMYCDNYWPMQFDSMWQTFEGHHQGHSSPLAQITIYRNDDSYSQDNIQIDHDDKVAVYDKSRTVPGLSGVEIGFLIVSKSVVDLIPEYNISFEAAVYPQLAANRNLLGYVTSHRYYSIGSQARLPDTAKFLSKTPVLLLDRDGVLNERMPRAKYVRSWADWTWLPGAKEALRLLKKAGYKVIIISNQPGIAFGDLTEGSLAQIHRNLVEEAADAGGEISAIYHCPHGWDDNCNCRKPQPGLLFQSQKEHFLDLTQTFFFGDDERDGQAARAAGCPWAQVTGDRSLLQLVKELLDGSLIASEVSAQGGT